MIGTTLKHFRIVAKLGEGGMGEVYRAEDTRLHREVAIKILPRPLTRNPDHVARFEREARALARLNHPNIAAIHEFDEQDGTYFLVMEYVPGETLADRIARGRMPLGEALTCAAGIARALETAHGRGIIHRDLKTLNIALTDKGAVKVLDFGLAKFFSPGPTSPPGAHDRTEKQTARISETGLIVGTAETMSPEQVRGETLDARTDIWAFGCVLFEMVSGRKPFARRTPQDTMAAVLSEEPPWDELPGDLPRPIRRLLRLCLKKDPDQRLHHAADARLELEDAAAGSPDSGDLEAPSVPLRRRGGILAAVTAAVVLGVVIGFALHNPEPVARPPVRAVIPPPDGQRFQLHPIYPGPAAISPDGTSIVFSAHPEDGDSRLWVRRLDQEDARPLPGTEDATYPFWSPDGRFIAFVLHGRLKKIPVEGGPLLTITETPAHSGGAWRTDGTILFSAGDRSIHLVSDGGGESRPVTSYDPDSGDRRHMHPRFLPDGDRFLYIAVAPKIDPAAGNRVMLGSISGNSDRELFRNSSKVEYARGYLWFTREGALLAQPFDPKTAETTGPPVAVGEGAVNTEWPIMNALGYFSVCPRGVIVYHAQEAATKKSQLTWYDREGRVLGTVGDPELQYHVALSRDGSHAYVQLVNPNTTGISLWSYDTARERKDRLTFEPNSAVPVPAPDGRRLAFSSNRSGQLEVYVQTLGRNDPRPLFAGGPSEYGGTRPPDAPVIRGAFPLSWSPDGSLLVYCAFPRGAPSGLWAVEPFGTEQPFPVQPSPFDQDDAAVSPDGRWIAYTSDATGRYEIYLARFPKGDRVWPVSSDGGIRPEWNPDGKELFFVSPRYELMAVPAKLDGESPELGAVHALFDLEARRHVFAEPGIYAVAPDGNRFLVNRFVDTGQRSFLNLIVGWPEEIEPAD